VERIGKTRGRGGKVGLQVEKWDGGGEGGYFPCPVARRSWSRGRQTREGCIYIEDGKGKCAGWNRGLKGRGQNRGEGASTFWEQGEKGC